MNYHQLYAMQRKRTSKKKPHVDVRVDNCRYCGETLVRLKTVARCFEVVRLEQDHVTWIDRHGTRRRDGIMTKDHVFPKSKGGRDGPDNIVHSCGPCNSRKADSPALLLDTGEIIFVEKEELIGD